jgi:hypothetical protein
VAIGWAIALASTVLGADLRLDAGLRAETRSRTVDARGQERQTTAEVSATPRVGADLIDPDLVLRAQYAATFRAPDVLTSTSPDVLHAAELRATLRLVPAWTLGAVAAAERGTTDLVAESRLRQTLPDAVPTTAALRYAALRGDLALEGAIDPRTRLNLSAGAFESGGDDAASRAVLAVERGLRSTGTLDWNAGRRDVVTVQETALAVRFMGDRRAAVGTLTGGWRRQLDPELQGTVRAGALGAWSDAPGESPRRTLLPAGEIGAAHASERWHTSEDAVIRMGAGVDRVTGVIERQVEVGASVRWAPASAWSLGGHLSGARVRQGPESGQRGALELRVEWTITPGLSAALGVYGQLQRVPGPAPSFWEGGGLASFAVDLPARR